MVRKQVQFDACLEIYSKLLINMHYCNFDTEPYGIKKVDIILWNRYIINKFVVSFI